MKRFAMVLLLAGIAGVMSGCSGNGPGGVAGSAGSSTNLASSLSASDLKAVEASLITTSLIAAEAAPVVSSSLRASQIENPPPFPMHGHEFHGARSGNEWTISRGDGGCRVHLEAPASMTPHLWMGRHFCRLEKTASGAILVNLMDGTMATIEPATAEKSSGEITIGDATWAYTWNGSSVTLKNAATGETLFIFADAEGRLVMAPQADHLRIGSESCKLEKASDGRILITRADGTVLTISPASDSSSGELTVDGVPWTYTWSDTSILTLKNSANGRTLTITEVADGSLVIVPPGGHPHPAHWKEDGAIEGSFPMDGEGFRFRRGRFQE